MQDEEKKFDKVVEEHSESLRGKDQKYEKLEKKFGEKIYGGKFLIYNDLYHLLIVLRCTRCQ